MSDIYWIVAPIALIIGDVLLYVGLSKTFLLLVHLAEKLEPPPQHGDQFEQMEVEAKTAAEVLALVVPIFVVLFLVLIMIK